MSSWGPTPKHLLAIDFTAELVGCHQVVTKDDTTFGSDFLLLVDRLINQYGDNFTTIFDGILSIKQNLFTGLMIVEDIYKYNNSTLSFNSPTFLTQPLTLQNLIIDDKNSTGTPENVVILGYFLQPSTSTTSYVNFGFEAVRFRFYPTATSPYALFGFSYNLTTNGLQIYEDRVNILSELQIRSSLVNPVSYLGPYTVNYSTNPTGNSTFTTNKTTLTRIDISYRNLTKTSSRGTVFIQFGESGSYGSNVYAGLSVGNYAFDLGFSAISASTTNGFPLFNDYMEQNYSMNGTITLYKMGNTASGGQLWAIQSSSYIYYNTVTGVDDFVCFGAGYVETTATYPAITSYRFNCASTGSPGLLSNGTINILTV